MEEGKKYLAKMSSNPSTDSHTIRIHLIILIGYQKTATYPN